MSVINVELGTHTEQFPKLTQGGHLLFCFWADEKKLASILFFGIKPRGGEVEAASYYPDVVSLTAISSEEDHLKLTDSMSEILNILYLNRDLDFSLPCPYALVLDPKWIRMNIQHLVGVGKGICDKRYGKHFRVNALEDLPLSEIKGDLLQTPLYHEVHYSGGTIPVEAFAGVVHGKEMGDFFQTRDFIGADLMLRGVVRKARQNGVAVSSLALYHKDGRMFGII